MIPIENIYYMLSYSVGVLPPNGERRVSVSGHTTLVGLLADGLIRTLTPVTKRGLYKTYVPYVEETSMPQGRIQMKETMRLAPQPKVVSNYDDFSADHVHNQIIRATLVRLLRHGTLDKQTTYAVRKQLRYFRAVKSINVLPSHFHQLQYHKHNEGYQMILSICEMIWTYAMVDERSGKLKFIDFERTQLHVLFESFVRNFYKLELNGYRVAREYIEWNVRQVYKGTQALVPKMYTDMSITNAHEKMIVDTKYYEKTFQQHFETQKIHSPHLYQLYSYLSNAQQKPVMRGMLLYPQVDEPLMLQMNLDGYEVTIATVNLAAHWTAIRARLLTLFNEKMDRA
jgi:5-methylcytosine-specific restriction enzyme subunit McrC